MVQVAGQNGFIHPDQIELLLAWAHDPKAWQSRISITKPDIN
jgi:hypothetical protein